MSFGRKSRQPQFQPFKVVLPTGDRIVQRYNDGAIEVVPKLSQASKHQLAQSNRAIKQLTNELIRRPGQERELINSQKQLFYDRLRRAIDEASNARVSQTRSDLARRFGGSLNATFGNDLLSRLERERLNATREAQTDSTLFGQYLLNAADQSRLLKLQALQGQMGALLGPAHAMLPSMMRNAEMMRETLSRQQQQQGSGFWQAIGSVARFALPF